MKVIDPGHVYEVDVYDGDNTETQRITFMKREGKGFPGNVGHHPGTNCQEILRVLINRILYLNNQIPCDDNKRLIYNLRYCLLEFERRAIIRHGADDLYPMQLWDVDDVPVENMLTCRVCGHTRCKGHEKE